MAHPHAIAVRPVPMSLNALKGLISGEAWAAAVDMLEPSDFERPEEELAALIKPTPTLWALRVHLWSKIRHWDMSGREKPITPTEVYAGICTAGYWHRIIRNPDMVAWLVSPMQDYAAALGPLLHCGLDRYREIVSAPLIDDEGRLDVGRAKLVCQVLARIEDRVMGGVVQRSHVVQATVPGGAPPQGGGEGAGDVKSRIQELELALKALEQRERAAMHLPDAAAQESGAVSETVSETSAQPAPVSASVPDPMPD